MVMMARLFLPSKPSHFGHGPSGREFIESLNQPKLGQVTASEPIHKSMCPVSSDNNGCSMEPTRDQARVVCSGQVTTAAELGSRAQNHQAEVVASQVGKLCCSSSPSWSPPSWPGRKVLAKDNWPEMGSNTITVPRPSARDVFARSLAFSLARNLIIARYSYRGHESARRPPLSTSTIIRQATLIVINGPRRLDSKTLALAHFRSLGPSQTPTKMILGERN